MELENIVVDITQRNYNTIQTIQYDVDSRYVNVKIVSSGKNVDLTNYMVSIACKKPDGKIVFNETEMIEPKQGLIKFLISEQITTALGEVVCELKIYGKNSSVLTTQYFTINVTQPIADKAIQSTNEFRQLTVAMNEYNAWISKVEEKYNGLEEEYAERLTEISTQLSRVLAKNLRMVSKADSEYTTIMSAVEAGGDTIDNPITIMVAPGMYEEQVYIRQWSRINLVGTNKKDCIVVNHGGGYTDEPLITAGERYIANMTFRATHEKSTTTDKNQWKSYAFHGDKSSGGDGTTLVENCRFESYHTASVGLGIYNNQTFHFKNCEFYSKIDYDSTQANIGAFFAHNNVAGGATNGELILENCTFFMDNDRSGYGYACYINDANLTNGDGIGNAINVKFINCTLKRRNGNHVNAIKLDNTASINNLSGSILLDKTSHGNNISCLNFPQLIWNDVALSSPIANVGSSFAPLRYSKDVNGKVRIEGTISGLTSGSSNTLFTLPIGYRPMYHKFYDVVNYSGSTPLIGKLLVNRSGVVTIEGTLNTARTDICVEFYAEQ